MKMHAIIEKTAVFVNKHGAQMEIIIKTRQKDNSQFEFLNYENELNPYYKQLVNAIKLGKYQPTASNTESNAEQDGSHSYLHPCLTSSAPLENKEPEHVTISSQEFLNSIQAKLPAGQIANTPYAKLLSNLSKHTSTLSSKTAELIPNNGNTNCLHGVRAVPTPPPPSSSVIHAASHTGIFRSQHNMDESERYRHKASNEITELLEISKSCEESKKKDPIHGPLIIPPPPDQQPIIDKMADYVARNGPEFEMVVQMKNDTRFHFLDPDHIHYNYYQYKKNIFIKDMEMQKSNEKDNDESKSGSETGHLKNNNIKKETKVEKEHKDERTVNKSVSFSIKAKEEEVTSLRTRTALLYDSDDEDDAEHASRRSSQSESDLTGADVFVGQKPPSRNVSRASLLSSNTDRPQGGFDEAEKKQAEQKLADRLAAAAREKMARASRDKQLQAQRKRKAAMFINMLRESKGASQLEAPLAESCLVSTSATFISSSTDNIWTESMIDSPCGSSIKSRSVTPTVILEQAMSSVPPPITLETTTSISIPPGASVISLHSSSKPSRKRSRSRSPPYRPKSPKRHRKRSKTPPTAYTVGRRCSSRSPVLQRSRSCSRSKAKAHSVKHSRARSRSNSKDRQSKQKVNDRYPPKGRSPSRSSDHKSKKESKKEHKKESRSRKTSGKSHKKKCSDRESRHHKSKLHKSKSGHRRSESVSSSCSENAQSLQRTKVKSSVGRVSPIVVDLTVGSPKMEDESVGKRQESNPRSFSVDIMSEVVPHIEMLSKVHELLKAKRKHDIDDDEESHNGEPTRTAMPSNR